MEENKKTLSALIGLALILTLANLLWTYSLYNKFASISDSARANSGSNQNILSRQNKAEKIEVTTSNAATIGSSDALVTIVEFSDFQCPYCARAAVGPQAALPQIEEKYIKTGKAKLIFRNFPLPFHENAQKAAEAGQCAAEQGKFWEMHEKLFANQNALAIENLKKYASELKLDTAKFNSCLDIGKYAQAVQNDLADGTSYGVGGTPSFFIAKGNILVDPEFIQTKAQANEYIIKVPDGATMIIGAQPFSEFEKVIEEELKK